VVVAVTEVVDVVSLDRVDAIIEGSLEGSLASSCEVCLKSWSSCVEDANTVSIVSPSLSKGLF
jgi:hypothetical protein